jgi:hypothetical protein
VCGLETNAELLIIIIIIIIIIIYDDAKYLVDVILKPQKLITIHAKTAKYRHLKHVLYLTSSQQPTVMVPVISTRLFLYCY